MLDQSAAKVSKSLSNQGCRRLFGFRNLVDRKLGGDRAAHDEMAAGVSLKVWARTGIVTSLMTARRGFSGVGFEVCGFEEVFNEDEVFEEVGVAAPVSARFKSGLLVMVLTSRIGWTNRLLRELQEADGGFGHGESVGFGELFEDGVLFGS